jgi:HAD superfamily hydrolase (TIGR01509 family)
MTLKAVAFDFGGVIEIAVGNGCVLNTELVAIIAILKRQGFKVGILSNATTDLREILREHEILELFDEVIISGEIGFQKPDKEAFAVLFEQLGVSAEDAIFVDDSPRSLEKAEQIGYIPIHFKNNSLLVDELRSFGIVL